MTHLVSFSVPNRSHALVSSHLVSLAQELSIPSRPRATRVSTQSTSVGRMRALGRTPACGVAKRAARPAPRSACAAAVPRAAPSARSAAALRRAPTPRGRALPVRAQSSAPAAAPAGGAPPKAPAAKRDDVRVAALAEGVTLLQCVTTERYAASLRGACCAPASNVQAAILLLHISMCPSWSYILHIYFLSFICPMRRLKTEIEYSLNKGSSDNSYLLSGTAPPSASPLYRTPHTPPRPAPRRRAHRRRRTAPRPAGRGAARRPGGVLRRRLRRRGGPRRAEWPHPPGAGPLLAPPRRLARRGAGRPPRGGGPYPGAPAPAPHPVLHAAWQQPAIRDPGWWPATPRCGAQNPPPSRWTRFWLPAWAAPRRCRRRGDKPAWW